MVELLSRLCVHRLRNTMKISIRIDGVMTEVRTEDLRNKCLQHYSYINVLACKLCAVLCDGKFSKYEEARGNSFGNFPFCQEPTVHWILLTLHHISNIIFKKLLIKPISWDYMFNILLYYIEACSNSWVWNVIKWLT